MLLRYESISPTYNRRETPSCRRCRQFGVACEGYGVRLSWVPVATGDPANCDNGDNDLLQPPPRGTRSAVSLQSICPPPLTSLQLDTTLESIDEWRPGEVPELETGAFCVFSTRSMATRASTDPPRVGPTMYADEVSSAADYPESDDTVHSTVPTSIPHDRGVTQGPSRHLDALAMPAQQNRLIHHWITFTSRKIVLIDEPHNPCRTMMLPMALQGLVAHIDASNADIAIFHAICAAAAYNLYELSGRTHEEDHVLALHHDDAAVHHLRHNLSRVAAVQDQSFAMAIMACIAVEAVSGTTQRWRTHVLGGLAYLTKLQDQGVDDVTLSPFRQHMVKMAILCGFEVPDHLKEFLFDESGASDGLEFTFPYYGVSRRFLRAHDHINGLLARNSSGTILEADKELDSFELQMYLDFPSHDLRSTQRDPKHASVIQHTSRVFYYAGLVFFKKAVREAPLDTVQELVELGIQEFEALESLGSLGCIMLWPALVLGAECNSLSLQGRMQGWFQAQHRLGFRNLIILEELVAKIWFARRNPAAAPEESDWRHVIAQAQYDVFRL